MTTAQKGTLTGRIGAVAGRGTERIPAVRTKELADGTQRRALVDPEELPAEYRDAIEAEEFIIYGKASVETWDKDEPSQKLTMEALTEALPGLYDGGIVSRRHKDIPVGEIIESYTLEKAASIPVADQVYEFEAGDTIETAVGETDGDGIEEFWVVCDLRNDSEIAKETRLKALTGELDGFSVTIYAKEWEETPAGQEVTKLDWHAVTIGRDEQIKNPDSRFGVAEFKAFFERDRKGKSDQGGFSGLFSRGSSAQVPDGEELVQAINSKMNGAFHRQLFGKSAGELGFDQRRLSAAAAFAEKLDDNNIDLSAEDEVDQEAVKSLATEAAEEYAGSSDLDAEAVATTYSALQGAGALSEQKADPEDVQAALDMVEAELNPEVADVLSEAINGDQNPANPENGRGGEPPDPEEEDRNAAGGEMKMEDLPEGVVTEEKLDETVEEITGQIDDLQGSMEKALTEALPEAVEDAASKMATGETTDPSGGPTNDQSDYSEAIKQSFGGSEGGQA